jgi:hypothetical protein
MAEWQIPALIAQKGQLRVKTEPGCVSLNSFRFPQQIGVNVLSAAAQPQPKWNTAQKCGIVCGFQSLKSEDFL